MVLIFVVLVGLSIASFIGSLSYRIPRNISIVTPPSFCISCKKRLKPYDLIPVLSYILLGGRCRYCRSKIPLKYFILELSVPLIYAALYLNIGPGCAFFIYCYLITVLVYLTLVDIDYGTISFYDIIPVYPGGIVLMVFSFLGKLPYMARHYLYGAAAASVLLLISCLIVYIIKKRVPIGVGDLLVIPGVSLHFGMVEVIRIMIFSSIIGVLSGFALIYTGKVVRDFKFPMIPFLTAGVFIEILLF